MQFSLYVTVLDLQPYGVGGLIPGMGNFFCLLVKTKSLLQNSKSQCFRNINALLSIGSRNQMTGKYS